MLYWGLQYCNYNEDQQEVCRTTLLSLCKAQCQVESHEVHDFLFFALSINTCLIALEAMSSERLFAKQFEEIIWNCMEMNCIWTLTSIARQTAHYMWYSMLIQHHPGYHIAFQYYSHLLSSWKSETSLSSRHITTSKIWSVQLQYTFDSEETSISIARTGTAWAPTQREWTDYHKTTVFEKVCKQELLM